MLSSTCRRGPFDCRQAYIGAEDLHRKAAPVSSGIPVTRCNRESSSPVEQPATQTGSPRLRSDTHTQQKQDPKGTVRRGRRPLGRCAENDFSFNASRTTADAMRETLVTQ